MGIHTGPKDGDYARYMEFLSSGSQGEPGKVYKSRQAAPEGWSTESEAPPLPDGFNPEPVAINPMVSPERAQRPGETTGWSVPELDAALDKLPGKRVYKTRRTAVSTFPDPAGQGKPVVVLPGQGGAWDARDTTAVSKTEIRKTNIDRGTADRSAGVPPVKRGAQRIALAVVTIVAWIVLFNAVSALVSIAVLANDVRDVKAYIPAVFLLVFGLVLLRIRKGLKRDMARAGKN